MTAKPNIILFNGYLLPQSEAFVRSQGEALNSFNPYYVGTRLIKNGLPLSQSQVRVINKGSLPGYVKELIFKYSGFAPEFNQQLQQLNPALIHAHFGVCGTLVLPLAQKLKIPLIVTYHGLDATMSDEYTQKKSINTRIYLQRREALKLEASLFITVSNFLKERLIQQGFPSDKILVHHIGVDTKLFQPDCHIAREPIVLFVAPLVEKKGCEYLIQAMAKLQAVMPEVELVIIGDGQLRAALEHSARSSLFKYKFLGVQPPEVIKHWMNLAKVFCAPSITTASGDSEGLPKVIIEAQAMGLPVVASVHGGIPEGVIHRKTGFLAAEGDSQALAKYILLLLINPQRWQSFSSNARKHINVQFNLNQQTRLLEDIYQGVLSRNRTR
jgi:colanic acid/amylovoran biosynthesis glycosyltransferase